MRKAGHFSPLSLGISFALLLLLGIFFLLRGNLIFSPGAVSAKSQTGINLGGFTSHAEFERDCQLCHLPLKSQQAPLCMECHRNIDEQIAQAQGTHAKITHVDRCANCHAEHRGRDFDPTQSALIHFDHTQTRFSLDWHQFNYDADLLECSACHNMEGNFVLSQETCVQCHTSHDASFMSTHQSDFGLDCLACHDGKDSMTDFNHRTTNLPLDGRHAQIRCADCHINGQFNDLSAECIACHAEPDAHRGLFEPNCSSCHTTLAWKPAIVNGAAFDHARNTSFSLNLHHANFDGSVMNCQGCHPQSVEKFSPDICIQCHAQQDTPFMNEHQALFGTTCLECHDGVDRYSNFDHNQLFLLDGQHANLDCQQCHVGQRFQDTPSACSQCHTEPVIHAGWFGLQCQNCHTNAAWTPARMTLHPFPLDHGMDQPLACEVCHASAYTEYTCYGCHDHQSAAIAETHAKEEISSPELNACVDCHPVGEYTE